MPNSVSRSRKGFTLIELIVVLAILAIVAAIAVPTAFASLRRAENAAGKASLNNIISAVRTAGALAQVSTETLNSGSLSYYYVDGTFTAIGGDSSVGKTTRTAVQNALAGTALQIPADRGFYLTVKIANNAVQTRTITYFGTDRYYPAFYYGAEKVGAAPAGYFRMNAASSYESLG